MSSTAKASEPIDGDADVTDTKIDAPDRRTRRGRAKSKRTTDAEINDLEVVGGAAVDGEIADGEIADNKATDLEIVDGVADAANDSAEDFSPEQPGSDIESGEARADDERGSADKELAEAAEESRPPGAPVPAEDLPAKDLDVAPEDVAPEDVAPEPGETRKARKARQAKDEADAKRDAAEARRLALEAEAAADAAEKVAAAERAATRSARFRRGLHKVIRRGILLAVLVGIAAVIYLAWPQVNERLLEPVETNRAEVNTIRDDVAALQNSSTEDTSRLADMVVDLTDRLDASEAETSELQGQIESLTSGQDALTTQLGGFDERVAAFSERIDGLAEQADLLDTGLEASSSSTNEQLSLMRASDLLSRARLYLYQANYGLAKSDIALAHTLLADLQAQATDSAPLLAAVTARLDLALANLPDRPVAAAGDLDIAWQALLSGQSDGLAPAPSFVLSVPDQAPTDDGADAPAPVDDAAGAGDDG